jgi:hypothetical protein
MKLRRDVYISLVPISINKLFNGRIFHHSSFCAEEKWSPFPFEINAYVLRNGVHFGTGYIKPDKPEFRYPGSDSSVVERGIADP